VRVYEGEEKRNFELRSGGPTLEKGLGDDGANCWGFSCRNERNQITFSSRLKIREGSSKRRDRERANGMI